MSRVLLDCDGVMSDFTGYCLDIIEDSFGRRYTPEDVTQWNFGNLLKSPGESATFWAQLKLAGVAAALAPIVDSDGIGPAEAVRAIRDRGYSVYVVTSPMSDNPTWGYEREEWLRRVAGVERSNVLQTPAKHVVAGNFLVDDNQDNIAAWSRGMASVGLGPSAVGLLQDAAYNREFAAFSGVASEVTAVRVFRWADVFRAIEAYS